MHDRHEYHMHTHRVERVRPPEPRKVCTFCGQDGHRAHQCRKRKAAVLKAQAADIAARIILAPAAAVRWLHAHPDYLTTGVALIAGAAGVYLISTGG